MKKIVLLGTGEHAKSVAGSIEAQGKFSVFGLFDNRLDKETHFLKL